MDLLVLPGSNSKTLAWAENVISPFKSRFEEIRFHEYGMWKTGTTAFDIKAELEAVKIWANGRKNLMIFGKSVGSWLAVQSIQFEILNPQLSFFVGVPLGKETRSKVAPQELFHKISAPVVIIQGDKDPICPAAELKVLLDEGYSGNWKFFEVQDNDHWYNRIEDIQKIMAKCFEEFDKGELFAGLSVSEK
ncbi:MAG: dienelactone hydrolase family protein [Candidatus Riflebacteria bacterium]|nr:dienelactone hydrolase family protein [Candidatus Riflebacteria bacterium]